MWYRCMPISLLYHSKAMWTLNEASMCWGVTDVAQVYALPLHHHSKAMWTLNEASMCWGVTDVVHVYALPLAKLCGH